MRSKINWLNEGDSNTKFFHISATNNRKRNEIIYFKDPYGNWIDDPKQIMEHTHSYFQDIFSTSHNYSDWSSIKNDTPSRHQIDLSTLDTNISPVEIKNAIFSFKPFKSPGSDGLHPFFFQKHCLPLNLQ